MKRGLFVATRGDFHMATGRIRSWRDRWSDQPMSSGRETDPLRLGEVARRTMWLTRRDRLRVLVDADRALVVRDRPDRTPCVKAAADRWIARIGEVSSEGRSPTHPADARDARNQGTRVWVLGRPEELFGSGRFHDAPEVHDRNGVAHEAHRGQVVR